MWGLRAFGLLLALGVGCVPAQSRRVEVRPQPVERSQTSPAQQPAANESATPVVTRSFDPAIASPSPIEQQIRDTLLEEQPKTALRIAETALRQAAAKDKQRLHWLAAEAAEGASDSARAAAHLSAAGSMPGPLRRWAKLLWATQMLETETERVVLEAASLTDAWTGQYRARLLEAKALIRLGRTADAEQRLRVVIQSRPKNIEAQLMLAQLLSERDDRKASNEAIALLERIASDPANGPATQIATRRLQELRGSATTSPSAKNSLALAQRHYDAKRYARAEAILGRLARSRKKGDALRCEARLLHGKSILRRRDRAKGAPWMAAVARECSDREIRVWARYHSGRAYSRLNDWPAAISQFEALEKEAPTHRLADDAAFRVALAKEEQGKLAEADRLLLAIPKHYPHGDMWAEALFRVAWRARKAKQWTKAIDLFDELIRGGSGERDEGIVGRAHYWRARTIADLGDREAAALAYARIAKAWPLRYYAQQSLARLDEIEPETAEAIRAQMRHETAKRTLTFTWHSVFDKEGFRRAVDLLRVGESTLGMHELRELRMVGAGADPKFALVSAVLLQTSHADQRLDGIVRKRFRELPGLVPVGDNRALWEAAYPPAFSPLIEQVAKGESLPPAFVRAIAREESSFDPAAVSWAKAYGLVQIILPTAKRFGKELGLRVTPYSLTRPRTNLRIGARYMKWLWDRFADNPALIPAAYNAGENAVRRWLREDGNRPLDVFIEEIPYDETRRYTRRVLQTYGVYSWLESEKLPELPKSLPKVL